MRFDTLDVVILRLLARFLGSLSLLTPTKSMPRKVLERMCEGDRKNLNTQLNQ